MKKFLIIFISAVLLVLYGIFLFFWHGFVQQYASAPTQETETASTEITTAPAEATIPTTAPTEPYETVMPQDYTLTATHAFVYDCASGEMLYTLGDQTVPIAPASLTKLFTAYVALQFLDEDTVITVGEEVTWIDPASSVAGISPGDRIRADLLLQGMLMQSGNDAAYTMAVSAGRMILDAPDASASRALAAFMDEVNRQLQQLGLRDTHFVTPDGLDADGHMTTLEDMLHIAVLALDTPLIRHYSGIATDRVVDSNGKEHEWLNTNFHLHKDSLYYFPECCGLKTGSTSKAGACLLASFYSHDRYIIIGVFCCPTYEDRFADTAFLFEQYGK